jgi:hypothetical protein
MHPEAIKSEQKEIFAKPAEIATMKAYTLNHRGAFKDYVDLYFLLKDNWVTLKEIEELGGNKYGEEFNFRLFLEQLVYLEDIKTKEIEFLGDSVDKQEMKDFFEEKVKNLNF